MNDFFLFDSLMQDISGMSDPNSTAVAIQTRPQSLLKTRAGARPEVGA
jgi:hypothetical protein